MKNTVFLILSAMAILFCGCSTGPNHGLLGTAGNAMINANPLPPLEAVDGRGVCLPISAQSSVNIDVECILDYVQSGTGFDPADERIDLLNPWIRLNYAF
jgi:hypothetical protein